MIFFIGCMPVIRLGKPYMSYPIGASIICIITPLAKAHRFGGGFLFFRKEVFHMADLKIEYIPLEDINPYEHNAKLHPDSQVEQIMQSIQLVGFNDPIAIWKDNIIIEGHGRYEAAKRLALENVPVIRLDDLTDEQRRAYALIHNKLTMNTGFDLEALNVELAEIQSIDMSFFDFAVEDFETLDSINLDELFTDAPEQEKKPKEIVCPHCGEKIEI